jgi:hypothetical protein
MVRDIHAGNSGGILMKIKMLVVLFLISSLSFAFDISPMQPNPGDKITLKGTASPGEEIDLRTSMQIELPVNENGYEYETSLQIPQKPNKFTISVSDIKDLNVGVKIIFWITKRFEASSGKVSISQANIPPGNYDVRMFGVAQEGVSVVPVEIEAETSVMADPQGEYTLVIDTSGMPSGEYRIEGQGQAKTIRIGQSQADRSDGDNEHSSASQVEQRPSTSQITEETVRWYAGQIHLDPGDPDQYARAERLLKKRLSGDYWRIITKGEPLTEAAGNCEESYCLVRGIDACRECREKDMLISSGEKSNESSTTDESSETMSNLSSSEALTSNQVENKDPLNKFLEWIF